MSDPIDHELIARWRDKPAPLLPLLHAFHDRDGYLSDDALRAVATVLRIPLADLYGTVTFYHHFSRDAARPQASPRVCTGPVCALRGGQALLDALTDQGATRHALRRPLRSADSSLARRPGVDRCRCRQLVERPDAAACTQPRRHGRMCLPVHSRAGPGILGRLSSHWWIPGVDRHFGPDEARRRDRSHP